MLTRNDNNGNVTYAYNNAAHKHAVSQIGSLYYCYDANGNMTKRGAANSTCTTGGDTLAYDQENRLTSIVVGSTTTTFTYDGDGNRVKKVAGGVATFYIGNYYEVTNNVATKYYYFGKQRVAMRTAAGVVYLHSDHLGSSSVVMTQAGTSFYSRQTYYPYGAQRTQPIPQMRSVHNKKTSGFSSEGFLFPVCIKCGALTALHFFDCLIQRRHHVK